MKRLTYNERKILEKLLNKEMGLREIGRAMERSHSVIKYEIDKHSGQLGYIAERAQESYERKQLRKGNKKRFGKT